MQPDPLPIDVTPNIGAPTPATHGPGSRVRWAIVGFVALLAVIGGATVLAQLRRPGPTSAEKLAELLVLQGRPAGSGRVSRPAQGQHRREGHDRGLGLDHQRWLRQIIMDQLDRLP